MKYIDSHTLQMFLAINGIEPIMISGTTAYYLRSAALEEAL